MAASAAAFILAGCATQPMSNNEATRVPAERVAKPALTVAQAGTGSIVVKRDSGLAGSACTFRLFIDGEAFADISHRELIQIYLPPGEYILSAKGLNVCGAGTIETALKLDTEQVRTYRIAFGAGMDAQLLPTAF